MSQASPFRPAGQMHLPVSSSHSCPLAKQAGGQDLRRHDGPDQPGSHSHAPPASIRHRPCASASTSHAGPIHGTLHTHAGPAMHVPWPAHSTSAGPARGQPPQRLSQEGPLKPGWHTAVVWTSRARRDPGLDEPKPARSDTLATRLPLPEMASRRLPSRDTRTTRSAGLPTDATTVSTTGYASPRRSGG